MMIVVLGGLAGLLITKRVLRRVDAMTDAAERIMAGNIGQRCPSQAPATSSTAWRRI